MLKRKQTQTKAKSNTKKNDLGKQTHQKSADLSHCGRAKGVCLHDDGRSLVVVDDSNAPAPAAACYLRWSRTFLAAIIKGIRGVSGQSEG